MPQTGPKTAAGKAAVSRNATRHGIRSEIAVIDGIEDPKEWEWHRQGIIDSLKPEGVLEIVLADQIAFSLWKLRRVAFYQALQTRCHIDQAEYDLAVANAYAAGTLSKGQLAQPDSTELYGAELLRILPIGDTLDRIMRGACPERSRRKAHLHRLYIQTLHELEALQTLRKGGNAPLARLDIIGAPA